MYALKEVDFDFVAKHDKMEAVLREKECLEAVRGCKQIVSLDDTFMEGNGLFFVMEFAG